MPNPRSSRRFLFQLPDNSVWIALMQLPRMIRPIFPSIVIKVGTLVLALSMPVLAEGEAQRLDEVELRADAEETFKTEVGPFVKRYCTKCHGGGRAKANTSTPFSPMSSANLRLPRPFRQKQIPSNHG